MMIDEDARIELSLVGKIHKTMLGNLIRIRKTRGE